MDRLVDKLVVGIGCVIVVAMGAPDSYAVVGILSAVVASGLFEWLPRSWRTLAPDAFLVASLVWPQLLTMVPLMAYDALRWEKDENGYPMLPGVVPVALCVVALIEVSLVLPHVSVVLVWLFSGLAVVLCLRTTRATIREREQRNVQDELRGRGIALEARNRDLRDRQEYEVDLATMAERGRIARDIHDNVGHLLTRASLQVEALRVAYESDAALERSLEAVQGTVDEALASVRESVHALHEGTFDLADRLRMAVGEFEGQTTIAVRLSCDFDEVPTNVGLAFLAVVKEALSNAAHHGRARTVGVKIVEYPALYQLTVEDDGVGANQRPRSFGSVHSPTGMGLAAMEERILALGGHFASGPYPDGKGWRVFCSVPKVGTTSGNRVRSELGVSRETYVRYGGKEVR